MAVRCTPATSSQRLYRCALDHIGAGIYTGEARKPNRIRILSRSPCVEDHRSRYLDTHLGRRVSAYARPGTVVERVLLLRLRRGRRLLRRLRAAGPVPELGPG